MQGGIAIRFLFDDSSICLVNCHLGAGQSHVLQRNQDADHILQGAELDALPDKDVFGNGGDGSMVLDHEICIFSGDLNYRIDLPRDRVIRAVEGPAADWPTQQAILFEQDQLRKQQNSNQLFRLSAFHEAPITFTPTYKYDPGTDHYDRSEKKRIPAWCDRVLFRGDRVKNISYQRFECRVSDHRPISAGFEVQVKTIDPRKRDEVRGKVEAKWADTLERKIMESKVRYLVGYGYRAEEVERTLEQSRWIVNRALELLGRDQGVLAE
ncbi:Endonuclease/exonuclease/phosphatase [Jimgerdemannia flammicorona]|uniref:Endonuclease/exonuclease/phosphatase n=1 Tax=Jimgerdemannia flammicorona TaxID=994334 RepID=A0A433QLT7_9FUNG|nr:Endonuclease/exonuclease/phosphatase [Jimgerdemannia flammicorona]